MFPLVNLTKVSTAAQSMYFPTLFQLGSPLILVTALELCRVIVPFSPTANAESWAVEAFSLCVFTSTKSPRGPPWNEGYRPKVCHKTSVFEVPVQEQHKHSFFSSSTNTFITGSLYTVCGYRTSPGTPDLQARLGWLQGSTRNGM